MIAERRTVRAIKGMDKDTFSNLVPPYKQKGDRETNQNFL
jgi:hypothetical protein